MLLTLVTRSSVRMLSAGAEVVSIPSVCPLQLASGHACPLCGMTRAVGSLASGDVTAAVEYHPMAIVLSVQLAVLAVIVTQDSPLSNKQWFGAGSGRAAPLVWGNAVLFIAVWAFRWRFNMLDAALGS